MKHISIYFNVRWKHISIYLNLEKETDINRVCFAILLWWKKFGFLMASLGDINRPHHLLTVILKICYWEGSRSDDRINLFCWKAIDAAIILLTTFPSSREKINDKLTKLIYIWQSSKTLTQIRKCIKKYFFTSRSLSLSNSMPLLSSFLAIMDWLLKRQQRIPQKILCLRLSNCILYLSNLIISIVSLRAV